MHRLIKIAIAVSVALMCLFYALQNIVNLGPAFWFVQTMAGMSGHEAYPNHFGPAATSPAIVWVMLWTIILLELVAGALAGKGAFDMLMARRRSADNFNASKRLALCGCGIAILVWFGIFHAIGGAYFQMWQTEAGANALQGAFQYAMLTGLAWLIIRHDDR